jgi:hypothetical protein
MKVICEKPEAENFLQRDWTANQPDPLQQIRFGVIGFV